MLHPHSPLAGGRRSHSQAHEAPPPARRRVAFCDQVRRLRPDMAFGGDIIAGFPDRDRRYVRPARSTSLMHRGLTHPHAFPLRRGPGTPAARMLALAGNVAIKQRARHLRAKGEAALRQPSR